MPASPYTIFILEDDESFSMIIHKFLSDSLKLRYPKRKFELKMFSEANNAFHEQLRRAKPNALILDFHLGGTGGKEITGTDVMKMVQDVSSNTEVVILTSDDSLGLANSMMRSGAYDYIIKSPAAPIKVLKSVLNLLAMNDSKAGSILNRKLIKILGVAWLVLLIGVVLLKVLGMN